MKINQYIINKFNLTSKDLLDKGSLFKGIIADIIGSKVLIEIDGQRIIPARLDSKLDINIGDELTFLVKSSNKDEILIKAMNKGDVEQSLLQDQKNRDTSILKLLKNMNIEENDLSIDTIKNLIKSNATLNRENINNSIKIAEKIEQFASLKQDEQLLVLNELRPEDLLKSFNSSKSSIMRNEITGNEKRAIINSNISEETLDKIIGLKSDMKNILLVGKDTDLNEKDIIIDIKNVLDENKISNLKENLPKLTAFFIKNNIKPSLNNIINMQELNMEPGAYIENYKRLEIEVKNDLGEKLFSELFADKDLSENDNLDNKKNKILELLDIVEKAKYHGKTKIEKEMLELKNKNDFLNDINKNLLFTLLPMTNKKYDLDGVMSFIKKNNKKINRERTNVFISLNTKRLGNIKISCNFTRKSINLKFALKKEYLSLFQDNEKLLVEKISNLGFGVENINYLLEDALDIIDTLSQSEDINPTYYLDVKV